MYRINDIRQALAHLVGWRQGYDLQISETLTESESGVYLQDIHPLLTIENIESIAPNYRDNQQDWDGNDYFSAWLKTKTEASITKALTRFINAKAILNNAKTILESKTLFDIAGRATDVVRNTNSLVGMELIPVRADGVTLKVEKVGLQFNQSGNVKLYLYHSSVTTPIKTITLSYTKNGSIQWFDLNEFLPYQSALTDAGGSWYLVYDQTELPQGMQAIEKNRDWSKAPCRDCSVSEWNLWNAWSQWLEVHPFKAEPQANHNLWDIADNIYTYTTNYGINLQVTTLCDITDIIISQKMLFANVIALQVACDFLREMAFNPNFRINRTQQNFSRNDILYELDGDSTSVKKGGLGWELEQAYKAIDINTDGMNRVCLPCKSTGIRYRSI